MREKRYIEETLPEDHWPENGSLTNKLLSPTQPFLALCICERYKCEPLANLRSWHYSATWSNTTDLCFFGTIQGAQYSWWTEERKSVVWPFCSQFHVIWTNCCTLEASSVRSCSCCSVIHMNSVKLFVNYLIVSLMRPFSILLLLLSYSDNRM
jgi:hypothetical protein